MSEPIITRALLEHYLRATGWRYRSTFAGKREWEFQNWTAMIPERGSISAETMSHVGGPLKLKGYVVGARLGLCAAAEEMFAEASQWTPFDSEEPGDDGAEHEVLMAAWRRLLKMAGVDPKRWEEARDG